MRFTLPKAFFLAGLIGLLSAVSAAPVSAQSANPALQSKDSFLAALGNATWECSFNNPQRVRFSADKVEVVGNDNRVTGNYTNVAVLEPGVIQVTFNNGAKVVYAFGDDLKSFVIASITEMSEFDLLGHAAPGKLPATPADKPLEVTFKDNPFWKKMRLQADKMELLDDSGTVFATNPGIPFYPHGMGVELPEKRVGFVLLSRQRPGGWFLAGLHLGSGVRTSDSNRFQPFVKSKMTHFSLRTAHFNYALLRARQPAVADGQERYALYNARNVYGDTSETVLYAMNEMGAMRSATRSYEGAAHWRNQAYTLAKAHFGSDTSKQLEIGTDLAESQADMGDFAGAKATLGEIFSMLPPAGGDARIPYAFYKALGAAEFGLRNYAQAAKMFMDNHKRAAEADLNGYAIESLLDLAACQMALVQPIEAAASVRLAMDRQDAWMKKYPQTNFDTYKLAFACVALGKWEEAVKYSDLTQRRNSVTYAEYARLTALLNQGDKAGAKKMAQNFAQRFSGGLDEIQIRRDMDAMTVELTEAVAAQTAQATDKLEKAWAQQVESLRKRPLQNYIFARVVVDAIASLKNSK